jgi:hypothetical protein
MRLSCICDQNLFKHVSWNFGNIGFFEVDEEYSMRVIRYFSLRA